MTKEQALKIAEAVYKIRETKSMCSICSYNYTVGECGRKPCIDGVAQWFEQFEIGE